MKLSRQVLDTPIGQLLVAACDERLCAVEFVEQRQRFDKALDRFRDADTAESSQLPESVVRAFDAYFGGDVAALESLAVTTRGTHFQEMVWEALREIGPGETTSYSALAEQIGRPAATRAVGLANGMNPVALVIPCHRVVGKDGTLTGYAGGLARKSWLLDHEGARGQGELPLR